MSPWTNSIGGLSLRAASTSSGDRSIPVTTTPPVVQVTGHVPRPAAQVAHDADRPHPLGEGVQELAVERLVCQFTGDPSDVLVGDPVVTGLNLTGLSLAHRYSSTLRPAVSDTSP